jgi:hypothetical protein
MVDVHRPMRSNQMQPLHFGKVLPEMVMRLLSLITIAFEHSPVRLSQRKSFGRF